MNHRLTMTAATAMALAAAALPATASAKSGDRNHDRIPDRWEHKHHLSLNVNQARRDQDHDGLRNLAEYRDHTDPRDADTDDDGLEDGTEVELGNDPADRDSDDDGVRDDEENAGTVASFEGGVLTVKLASGGTLTATVTSGTKLECEGAPASAPTAQASHEDGDDDRGDDEREDEDAACDASNLTPGTVVREAEVETQNGQAVFEKVELRLGA